jgi:PKD domain
MNPKSIYERKMKGLDNSVWLFMCIIMLLSASLLTSFLVQRKKCIPFTFKITPKTDSGYYTEKTLSFSLSTSAKNVTWDFGDGTPEKTGVYVSHQYHKAGKFYVTASIKEGCDEVQEITVKKSLLDHSTGNEIEGPVTLSVEKEAEFYCIVYGSSWRWEVMDHPEIKPKSEKLGTAKFRFTTGGTYYIQVTLDDDRTKSYTKEIIITDDRVAKRKTTDINDIKPIFTDQRGPKKQDPVQPEEQQKITINQISNRSFRDKLNDVIADDNSSPSLEFFNQFLDKGQETTVKIEGGASMSFNKFYAFLKQNGSLKITDAILTRDAEKRVMFITVTISR